MFTRKEFRDICLVFGVYSASAITPMQVLTRLRVRNKKREIAILSNAMEIMPGYSNYLINEFIDLMRMKVVIE